MTFRNRKLKTVTAVFVLAAFGWMSSGGAAWAESCAARRDPARALLRLADDPRLALSPAEKAYARRAAHQMLTQPGSPPSQPRAQPVREPAADTWLPMDASFKLHSFTPGSRFFQDGPLSSALVPGDHLFEIIVGVTGNGLSPEVIEKRFAANPVDNAPEYLQAGLQSSYLEGAVFDQLESRPEPSLRGI